MDWATLFERAARHDVSVEAVSEVLATRRARTQPDGAGSDEDE